MSEKTLRDRIESVLAEHDSGGGVARWGGDALMPYLRAALDATLEPHQPGDPHDYRAECKVCGQPGTLQVSLEPQRAPMLGGVVEDQYIWFGVLSPENDFTIERVVLHAYRLGDGLRQPSDYISSFSACDKPRWVGAIVSGDPRCPDCVAVVLASVYREDPA